MARENQRQASFVADSPQIDPAFPGETYFYLVNGGGFRAGMRVAARISVGGTPVTGVIVPSAAVVWHAGKAWAYVKDDEQTFARFEVSTADETGTAAGSTQPASTTTTKSSSAARSCSCPKN